MSVEQQEIGDPSHRERTNLRTVITALIVLVIGLVLLMAANEWSWLRNNHAYAIPFVREISALLIVTVVATLIWELYAKRAFVQELINEARPAFAKVIEQTQVAQDLRGAGLKVFTTDFWNNVDWPMLFKDSNTLDMFFAYARSWVGARSQELQELARRPRARIRVVIPNPENPELMAELARRFAKTPEAVRRDILDTINDLMAMFVEPFKHSPLSAPDFSLFLSPSAPVFTFYKFDRMAVLALYKHRIGKGGIPVFVAERGGKLYEFLSEEMHGFIDQPGGRATQVYPIVPADE